MSWHQSTARKRIEKLISDAPHIEVEKFNDDYLPLYKQNMIKNDALGNARTPPLFGLPLGKAIVVDTVQVYVNIVNYDDYKIDDGQETEAAHAKALKFLHFHYSACDRVMETSAAQRVDFHDGRMHAVIIDTTGEGVTDKTIADAFAFIRDLRWVANQANNRLAKNRFTAKFRVGVDIGPCVAINNGTGTEQEPMFLGSPANHAAKLACGDEAGIYVSDKVRLKFNIVGLGDSEALKRLDESVFENIVMTKNLTEGLQFNEEQVPRGLDDILSNWNRDIINGNFPNPTNPNFAFGYKEPPLKEIDFADLMPSNSIRMPLASLFADLSGFTNYVDNSIAKGEIADAVKALYVIRQELQHVLEDDFGGRKVRFIGDCIHGLIAIGTKDAIDPSKTIINTAACAGGLRDSFELCQMLLRNIHQLGLAIGVEYGETPISRIGIRGDRSVRIASSLATTKSERLQQECGLNDTKFGPNALHIMPASLIDLIDHNGLTANLSYDDVVDGSVMGDLVDLTAPYNKTLSNRPVEKPRAHAKLK
ncbi:hypothetical protein [Glaciecola sp. SC05]|uniref:hypothetical protein n=1 Tax=Glaciecola sp. SC05 TaxID=1987355 RepID=UPI003526E6EC